MGQRNLLVRRAIRRRYETYVIHTPNATDSWDSSTGRRSKGVPTKRDIKAALINVSDEDLQLVPEGDRTEGIRTLYSEEEVFTVQEGTDTSAEILETPDGKYYKLIRRHDRFQGLFYKSFCGLYSPKPNELAP